MAILRRQYRRCVFFAGTRDLFHMGDVFQWLAENTFAADAAIQAALGISHAPAGFASAGSGAAGSL